MFLLSCNLNSPGKLVLPCERVDARWGKLECEWRACDLQGTTNFDEDLCTSVPLHCSSKTMLWVIHVICQWQFIEAISIWLYCIGSTYDSSFWSPLLLAFRYKTKFISVGFSRPPCSVSFHIPLNFLQLIHLARWDVQLERSCSGWPCNALKLDSLSYQQENCLKSFLQFWFNKVSSFAFWFNRNIKPSWIPFNYAALIDKRGKKKYKELYG